MRRCAEEASHEAGVVELLAGPVIDDLDEGQRLRERHAQPLEVDEAELANAARRDDPRDGARAEPGDTQQRFLRRPIEVDRTGAQRRMLSRPAR